MTIPIRDDQRRVMITLSVDRYNELKATARAYSLSMTGIINALIGDYLKAERNAAADMTGAGLAARVDSLEKRLATLSAMITPKRRRNARRADHADGEHVAPFSDASRRLDDAPIMQTAAPRSLSFPLAGGERDGETSTRSGSREPNARDLDAPIMQTANTPRPSADPFQATGRGGSLSRLNDRAGNDDATAEPRRDHRPAEGVDRQRERAAAIVERAPERVALASSLAKGDDGGERRAEQRTPLERRLEDTKRRAAAYALHGMQTRPAFQVQGAY